VTLSFYAIIKSQSLQGLITIAVALLAYTSIYIYLKNKRIGLVVILTSGIFGITAILGMLQIGPLSALLYKSSVTVRGYYWQAAVEMFIDKNGILLINEVAPRPHNSGHQSIEGNITSQFEQHLRAIYNLPLGDTAIRVPAAMINLLGEEGYSGSPIYEGLDEILSMSGVHLHLYGKNSTQSFRKMGHVTVTDTDIEKLKEKAMLVKNTLRIIS
jgi:hypothetical protein